MEILEKTQESPAVVTYRQKGGNTALALKDKHQKKQDRHRWQCLPECILNLS